MRFRWRPSRPGGWACCHQSQVRVSQNTLSLDSRHLSLSPYNPFLPDGEAGPWSSPCNAQQAPPEAHPSNRLLQPILLLEIIQSGEKMALVPWLPYP